MAKTNAIKEIADIIKDLQKLDRGLKRAAKETNQNSVDYIESKLTEFSPRQSPSDDTKPDQIALKDSFSGFSYTESPTSYGGKVFSTAPHALTVDQGRSYGDWKIPLLTTGVSWVPDDPSKIPGYTGNPNRGSRQIGDSGQANYIETQEGVRVFYSRVNVGDSNGLFYIRRALLNYAAPTRGPNIRNKTREAILRAGFAPGRRKV